MLIKPEYRLFNRAPKVALAALTLAVLSACGDGALEGKNFVSATPVNLPGNSAGAGTGTPTDPAATPSTPSGLGNDPMQQAANNAANASNTGNNAALTAAQAEMTRIAIEQGLAMQESPTANPGQKMLIVGLDSTSRSADNSAWLEGERFAGMSADDKERAKASYVSLTGDDLPAWFAQSCPAINDPDDREMFRCAAGIYFGKNAEGKMCFTTIGFNGRVQHVNDSNIVNTFELGSTSGDAVRVATQFTHTPMGSNTLLYINGRSTYPNTPDADYEIDPKDPYRSMQVTFTYNSAAGSLTILQKHNGLPGSAGASMNEICTINLAGAGT